MMIRNSKRLGVFLVVALAAACSDGGKKKPHTTPPPRTGLGGETEEPGEEPGMGGVVSRPKVRLTAEEKQSYEKALRTYEKLAKEAAKRGGWTESMCEKASSTFASVARSNPKLELYARHNEGLIWLRCGKEAKARGIFESVLAKERNFAPTLVSMGYLAAKAGDRAKAFRLFERAYLADPRCAEASFNLGISYRTKGKQGHISPSERERLRSLRFIQGYPAYAKWMAKMEAQGQTVDYQDLAVRHFQTVLAVTSGSDDPDSQVMNLRAYAMLALVYVDAAEKMASKLTLATLVINEANNFLKELKDPICQGGDHVTPMDKAVAELRNVDGLVELKKKHLVEAMKRFDAAVKCWPRFKEAHMNIGAIALSFRGYQRARDSFQAVLREEPKNLDAIMGLGVAYRGMSAEAMADEKDKLLNLAEAQYKKVLSLAPRNSRSYADALYNLGLLYQDYKVGQSDEENKKRLKVAISYYDRYVAHPKAIASARKDAVQRKKDILRTLDIMKQMAEMKRMEQERARRYQEQQRQKQQQKPQGEKPQGQKPQGQKPAR